MTESRPAGLPAIVWPGMKVPLVIATWAVCVWRQPQVIGWLGDLGDGSDRRLTMLGWLPIGGLAVVTAVLLAAQARRPGQRMLPRRSVLALTLWAAFAASFLPGRLNSTRDAAERSWRMLAGPAFHDAVLWSLVMLPVVGVLALAVLSLTDPSRRPRARLRLDPAQGLALALGTPYVVLLGVLLVWG